MKILAIETSCDETAVSIVKADGGLTKPEFTVLGQIISSQTAIHTHWGGVVPSLAKREHGRNLIPVLKKTLKQAGLFGSKIQNQRLETKFNTQTVGRILEREPELLEQFLEFIPTIEKPDIDLIAVTAGPGLEPALWTGINFAKALAVAWKKSLQSVNHMEGHLASVLIGKDRGNPKIEFPAVALLVSGGHTELVLARKWLDYKKISQTRDDAAGEAFDKVGRLLGLPYPGGPAIAKLAGQAVIKAAKDESTLPRPMINSDNFDFSFSGLKTAVLYLTKGKKLDDKEKAALAHEFQEAVIDVLAAKTFKATAVYEAKTLIVAGGVSANTELRRRFQKEAAAAGLNILIPPPALSTDNATMIAAGAYLNIAGGRPSKKSPAGLETITAQGNLSL